MHENNHSARKNDDDDDPSNFSIFLQGLDYFPRWDLKRPHCGKIGIFVQKSWARVIRKYFNWQFWYQNFILETWNWKLIQNTWSIETKMFHKILKIQANLKVSFLRRNDKMHLIKEFMEERRGLKLGRLSALAPSKSFEFPQNPQRWWNKNPLNFSNLQKLGM